MDYIMKIKLTFTILTAFSFCINAQPHWHNLSQQEYIDNLVDCQMSIKRFEWDKNLWPKENKHRKPNFDDVIDKNLIKQQVFQNLIKQNILHNTFNQEISNVLLQNNLNRMTSETKNPDGLNQLFAILDNNPITISQCVSLPYLVENMLSNRYYWDEEIHANLKKIAQLELDHYLEFGNTQNMGSKINYATYKLKSDSDRQQQLQEIDAATVYELEESDFYELTEKLSNIPHIEEQQQAFLFYESLEVNADTIKIKYITWEKPSLDQWLFNQSTDLYVPTSEQFDAELILPIIKNHSKTFNPDSDLNNKWKPLGHPVSRYLHSAVWTGNEMIVWGGYDRDGLYIKTGGRYNPITDNWVATKIQGAPAGRGFHSALWTGSEMIIWGGTRGSIFNSGSRYNPVNDEWAAMSTVNAPIARKWHSTVWTGEQMIVWGGSDQTSGTHSTDSGGIYDLSTDSWESTSVIDAPIPRLYHTAVWTGEEMVVWGGFNQKIPNSDFLNTGARYNPESNSWVATSLINAPIGRRKPTSVWTGNEMIIWGGSGFDVQYTGGKYDPSTDQWVATSTNGAPSIRYDNTTIWTGEEMIVWGGNFVNTFSNGAKYNPVSNNWTNTSDINAPSKRTYHSAVWTGEEMIVWGGRNDETGAYRDDGGRYNPESDSWDPIISNTVIAPSARSDHSAIWTGNEMIIWGGREVQGDFNTGGRYNPITNTWLPTTMTNVPSERYNHSTIWTGTEMIIWGGGLSPNSLIDTGGRYNPLNNTWLNMTMDGAPAARTSHTSIWTGTEMIVWGGYADGATNTGYKYQPSTNNWTPISTVNAPLARFYHTSAWTGDDMLIWGGSGSGSLQNTGGLYDPSSNTWNTMSTDNAPSARRNHTSVWTGTEMLIWSGDVANGLTKTGGKYNPDSNSWQSTNTVGAPTQRRYSSTVWTGEEMIVWGGTSDSGYLVTGASYYPNTDTWLATSTLDAPKARMYHTGVWAENAFIVWGGWALYPLDTMGTYYRFNDMIFKNGFD